MLKAKNRLLALLLSLAMLFSTLPAAALATEVEPETDAATVETVDDAAEEATDATADETEETATEDVAEVTDEAVAEDAEEAAEESDAEEAEEVEEVEEESVAEDAVEAADAAAEDDIAVASEDDISVAASTEDDNISSYSGSQPFISNDLSSSYRIPAIVTLSDGTIVAAADARYNTTYDGGGLDTVVSYSTDGGSTWTTSYANYLGDNGDEYNAKSTAFIDPCLVTDGKIVYMLVDLYPYGVALNGSGNTAPSTTTGFTDDGYLKLQKSGDSGYNYYLKDSKIYSSDGTVYEGYTVDGYFNITYMLDGVTTTSNLFFEDSPFTVVRTGYLYLTSSIDGGKTWSEPTLLNVKTSSEQVCLVGPGSGLYTSNDVIVFPVYSYNNGIQYTSLLYSTDEGTTWYRTSSLSASSSEAALVELSDGTIRVFYRNTTANLCYADYDMNTGTWSSTVTIDLSINSNTQLSALLYSKDVNGSSMILISCPGNDSSSSSASARTNGRIYAFSLEENNEMTLESTYAVNESTFIYSCLTELSDGTIGLLYENAWTGWGTNQTCSINYCNIAAEDITGEDTGNGSETENILTVNNVTVDFGSVAIGEMTVTETTVNALSGTDYIAYDVIPGSGYEETEATVTIPLNETLQACENLIGFYVDSDTNEVVTVEGIRNTDSYTFTVPHFTVVGVMAVTTAEDDQTYEDTTVSSIVGGSTASVATGNVITRLTINAAVSFDLNVNVSGYTVTWWSDDESIATVSSDGTVTGVAVGTATIYAQLTDSDGTVVDTNSVIVNVIAQNSATNHLQQYYIADIENTTVYYSLAFSTVLIEVIEGEMLYIYDDYNVNGSYLSAITFLADPDEGYALTYMNSTDSAGNYSAIRDTDGNLYTTHYLTRGSGAGFWQGAHYNNYKNSTSVPSSGAVSTTSDGGKLVEAVLQAGYDLGCDGAFGFTLDKSQTSNASSLTFISQPLPTVDKAVSSITKAEGNTTAGAVEIGDTINYTITVTVPAKVTSSINANGVTVTGNYGTITYSSATLTDELTGNNINSRVTNSNAYSISIAQGNTYTYTTSLTVTLDNYASVVVDGIITNTVVLNYTYTSTYSSGTLSANANAQAEITISLPSYVIDFGLPVTIDVSGVAGSATLSSGTAYYGTVTVDGTSFTYTPSTVLTGVEYVSLTFSNGQTYAVRIYPATTVYYEEGFATYGTGWSVTPGTSGWSDTTNTGKDTQQAHIANDTENTYNNYNYDDAYVSDTTGSEATAASTTKAGDSLSFTFTGTGVDIFANCDATSGVVGIKVADSEGTVKKTLTVNMADTGSYATGGTAYNTPIASISELDYDTYTVTIYLGVANTSGFKFDGFRVYDTISQDDEIQDTVYAADLEDSPVYYELRNYVLAGLEADTDSSTYADDIANEVAQVYATSEVPEEGAIVVYDSNSSLLRSETGVQDLLDDGPKNELYLDANASVVFKINTNREVQIGLRSVTGASVTYTISDGTTTSTYTTSSSVDMFYDLQAKTSGDATETTYTIKVTSGGILSITDIKECDSTGESIFGSLTADEVVAALTGETAGAETADAALTVDLADYTGSVIASTQLTATGVAGESATFAASDILSAVSEALPDGYALVDEDSAADQTVTYGENATLTLQIGKVATLTVTYQKYSGLFKKTTVGTVTLTKVRTSSTGKATFSASEIKAAVPSGYKVLVATSASVSYGSAATKTVTVY